MSALPVRWGAWRGVFRHADLAVLMVAIAVAVASSTTVGWFTDRLEKGIRLESATVLAADLRLESGRSVATLDEPEQEARRRGLRTAHTTSLTTVVHAADQGQLATVVASDEGYPLRGVLRIARVAYGPSVETTTLPSVGSAYVDPRLAERLHVVVGSPLRLGSVQLRIAAVLADRPDRGSGFSELAPALLVRQTDLAASGLVGPSSRATYTLLAAGRPSDVESFIAWLKVHKSSAERLIDVADSSAQLGGAADRADQFLHLAAVTTVLLAAVALVMASRRHAARRRDEVALLKCLGATRAVVARRFIRELGAATLVGGGAGIGFGYLAQLGLTHFARVFTGLAVLPAPGPLPALLGLATAVAMVAGFGLPPVLELTRVPSARVLREDVVPRALPLVLPALSACSALLLILYLDVRDLRLMAGAAVALTVIALVYGLIGWGLVGMAARVRSHAGAAWRFGIAALARRRRESLAQVVAFGMALTLLLLMGVIRGDLLDEWREALPADAPNHFLINIAPDEKEAVAAFFGAQKTRLELAPWVRARLLSVNGIPMAQRLPATERGRAFAEREQNLSFSADLPRDNRIVDGRWWSAEKDDALEVSVATEYRDELHLAIGDQLLFDIAGESVSLRLTSIRKVRWDGFRPNFFLLVSPGVLDDRVGSYLGAAHLDPLARRSLPEFNRRFPTVTVLDLDGLLGTVRRLVDQASEGVTYVFCFTLLAGLVVLQAALRATADERRFESSLLRAFGARRGQVLGYALAEFAAIGLLAGLAAATAAAAIGAVVAVHWLGLPWRPHFALWLWGPGAGVCVVGIAGALGSWRLTSTPPIRVLRGGG
jgi:putative ABC transport system permease protein